MKHTRSNKSPTNNILHTFASELVGRMLFASKMGGQQYGGDRDLYQALGYPQTISFDEYLIRYKRQDMAKAIINRPVKATWQGTLELVESENPKETPFEKAWRKLDRKFGLKTRLSRIDRLTGIGRYGILLLGLDDVRNRDDFIKPVASGVRKLKYIKTFSEKSALIDEYEINPKNRRYGMPKVYAIEVADADAGSSTQVRVHYSRVIHIIDDTLESEIFGTPRLEACFNRLMDIEKLVGGDAEMFWRGARPGYQNKLDPEYKLTPEQEATLQDQIDEFEHNLRRIINLEGMTMESLAQQIADPKNHMDILLTCVSAETGIPKRILSGSERGELASTQDSGEWKTYVQSRREDHAEPRILRLLVDRFIELGILPTPEDEYTVKWLDLFSISEKDRVDIGQKRSEALRSYTTNVLATSLVPPAAFYEYFLGLDRGQIQLIGEMVKAGISDEQQDLMKVVKKIDEPAPKPIPAGKPIPVKPTRKRTT